MRQFTAFRKRFKRGPSAFACQIALVISIKLMVLFGIWYIFIRDHKVPHGIPETTRHVLSQM